MSARTSQSIAQKPGLWVLPALLLLAATLFLPSFYGALLSLFEYRLGRTPVFVGARNYITLLRDTGAFWSSVFKTGIFAGTAVIGEMVVGSSLALLMQRRLPWHRVWVALLVAPMAVSPVVAIIVWRYMLQPNFGIVNYLIVAAGGVPPNWFVDPLWAFGAIIAIDVWMSAPFVFTILYPAVLSVDPALNEAAAIDGATWFQRTIYVTAPLVWPAFVTTAAFRFILAIRLFSPVWLFAQGGPAGATRVLSIFLYEQAFAYRQFGMASAVAVILLVMTLLLSSSQIRSMRRTMLGQ